MSVLWSLLAVAEAPAEDDGGIGLGIILVTLVLIVLVIGGVWTFVARRASRVPRREPHERDHVGRT
jgi:hypothetical protein